MSGKIVIAGAGSVGCFLGGLLLGSGKPAHLLARPRIADEISVHGLTVSDLTGLNIHIPAKGVPVSLSPDVMADADLILVTVKSGATPEIAEEIAAHAPKTATVISLQNGIGNIGVLRSALPEMDVRAGMVPYNILHVGEGHFHRGTGAQMLIEAGPGHMSKVLAANGLKLRETREIEAVQYGKLLVNLNNALNALAGMPLAEEFSSRGWRTLLADQIAEGLQVFKAAGIDTKPALAISTQTFARLLRLPTFVLRRVAGQILKIDPKARSSMWEDLELGRNTEIDDLQGVIIRLGQQHGVPTPVNQAVASLIKNVEGKPGGSPCLSPQDIRQALKAT